MEETWTILKVLQWTTEYFNRHGIEQARPCAEVLLAHVLGRQRIELYLHYDQPLTPLELQSYRTAIKRRAAREPTQYITQRQEFWSLEFEVNPSVLIPRPETELIVEMTLELMADRPCRVLDLGVGSGAIAVAVAHECPAARIVTVDISAQALRVARHNALRHQVADRMSFLACDLFSALVDKEPLFDLILTNPPYIAENELANLAPEVEKHEPQIALRGGGRDGLNTIRRILADAPRYLKPGGSLLLEMGHGQAPILQNELSHNRDFDNVRIIQDYSGIPRMLHACRTDQVKNG
jgi:release factor glutamine methyltransferase